MRFLVVGDVFQFPVQIHKEQYTTEIETLKVPNHRSNFFQEKKKKKRENMNRIFFPPDFHLSCKTESVYISSG